MSDRQQHQRSNSNGNGRRHHRSTAPPLAQSNNTNTFEGSVDNQGINTQLIPQSSTSTTTNASSLGRRQSMRRLVQRAIAAGINPTNDAVWTITTVENPNIHDFDMDIEGDGDGGEGSSDSNNSQDQISSSAARVRIRPTNITRQARSNAAINTLRQLTFAPDGTFPSTSLNIPIGANTSVAPSNTRAGTISGNPALRHKLVYKLNCLFCNTFVCNRAMRAILLADVKVELYSTDIPPISCALLQEDRQTQGCNCRIRDAACMGCGCVLGYHVSQPCERCLEARNNGHFWMFYAEGVVATERKTYVIGEGRDGKEVETPLYWNMLQPMVEEPPISHKSEVCR